MTYSQVKSDDSNEIVAKANELEYTLKDWQKMRKEILSQGQEESRKPVLTKGEKGVTPGCHISFSF